jgi:ribosomal protein S18 acetylase RimI-like enzyme
VIRPAREDDAQGIAVVHVRGWQAAYASVFSPEALAQLSVEEGSSMWRERIAAGRPIIVSDDDGLVEGFAAVGSARDVDAKGFGELYAIYVEPALWGRGLGRELIRSAEEVLRESGFTEAILWVVEDNLRARRFYEASGWRADASRQIEVLGADVPEVRYRKAL